MIRKTLSYTFYFSSIAGWARLQSYAFQGCWLLTGLNLSPTHREAQCAVRTVRKNKVNLCWKPPQELTSELIVGRTKGNPIPKIMCRRNEVIQFTWRGWKHLIFRTMQLENFCIRILSISFHEFIILHCLSSEQMSAAVFEFTESQWLRQGIKTQAWPEGRVYSFAWSKLCCTLCGSVCQIAHDPRMSRQGQLNRTKYLGVR